MTIDEAITQAREKAKEIRENLINGNNLEPYESYCNTMVAKSAEEYDQLAEWLEELNFLKQWKLGIMDSFCKYDVGSFEELVTNTRNKAIDDFAKWLENKKYLMKEIQDHDFCYTHYDELKANCVITEYFAEQLKAGGK